MLEGIGLYLLISAVLAFIGIMTAPTVESTECFRCNEGTCDGCPFLEAETICECGKELRGPEDVCECELKDYQTDYHKSYDYDTNPNVIYNDMKDEVYKTLKKDLESLSVLRLYKKYGKSIEELEEDVQRYLDKKFSV